MHKHCGMDPMDVYNYTGSLYSYNYVICNLVLVIGFTKLCVLWLFLSECGVFEGTEALVSLSTLCSFCEESHFLSIASMYVFSLTMLINITAGNSPWELWESRQQNVNSLGTL